MVVRPERPPGRRKRQGGTVVSSSLIVLMIVVIIQFTIKGVLGDDFGGIGVVQEGLFASKVDLWINTKSVANTEVLETGVPSTIPTEMPTEELTISPTVEPESENDAFWHSPTLSPTYGPTTEVSGGGESPTTVVIVDEPTTAPSHLDFITTEPTTTPNMAPSDLSFRNSNSPVTTEPVSTESPSNSILVSGSTDTPTLVPTPSEAPTEMPTELPTAEPSVLPTLAPTELPSATPTQYPSPAPTELPSVVPSDVPTIPPSEQPSMAPTVGPSEQPTVSPSELPTIHPSEMPTASDWPTTVPSVMSTIAPTNAPSVAPSTLPTVIPSVPPTASPSATPTVSPTAAPSQNPTLAPVCSPSVSPSIPPTIAPTVAPSFLPTTTPTANPTESPFLAFAPTIPPTAVPTVSPSAAPICTLSNNTVALLHQVSMVSIPVMYMAGNISSSVTSVTLSRKNVFVSWSNFTTTIQQLDIDNVPVSITLQQYIVGCDRSGCNNSVLGSVFSCSELLDVNLLWQSVVANRAFTSTCGGSDRWVGRVCAVDAIGGSLQSTYQICVNCANPCQLSSSSNSDFNVQLRGLTSIQHLTITGFHYQAAKQMWPSWVTAISSTTDTSIKVKYEVNGAGRIYCAAIPVTVPIYTPRTIQNYGNVVLKILNGTALNSGELTISELTPDTAYSLACFTRSVVRSFADQYRAPLQAIMDKLTPFRTMTSEFPKLSIGLPFKSVIVNEISPQIDVSFSYLLRANTTVYPLLRFYGDQPCPSNLSQWNGNRDYEEFSSDGALGAVAPSSLTFSSISSTEMISSSTSSMTAGSKNLQHGYFYLQTKIKGCYGLVFRFASAEKYRFASTLSSLATLSTASASSGTTSTSHDIPVSEGVLLINSTLANTVVLSSAMFAPSGLDFTIQFSGDTDMGDAIDLSSSAFDCDRIFNFTGVVNCDCQFTSASTVLATPTVTSGDLPVPGDVVLVMDGKLKVRCSDNNDCSNAPFLQISSVSLEADPRSSSSIVAVVTSPVQVSLGDNITMSISASLGNGGRPWKSIGWRVFYNFTTNEVSDRISRYMTTPGNMVLQNCPPKSRGCDTLPGDLFSVPGDYSFELHLQNFLGVSATYSKTIYVIPKLFVPRVWIVGQYYREVSANMSHLLRAELSNEDGCPYQTDDSGDSTAHGLVIKWTVFKDDVLDTSVVKNDQRLYYHDYRSLFIGKNILVPGHEYRFGVTVFCGSYFSYDEAVRYISANDIIPSIKNGDSITVGLQDPVTFDASATSKVYHDNINDLYFTWNCLQLSPLRPDGCDDFYEALLTLSNTIDGGSLSGSVVTTNGGKVSFNNAGSSSSDVVGSSTTIASFATLSFEEPWKIFNPAAKYLISVTVTSASLGVSGEARQTMTTLPLMIDPLTHTVKPGLLATPRLSLSVPSFSVNNSFGYALNATILSDVSFVAEWQVVGMNDTLASRTFINGGVQFFAAILPNAFVMSSKAKVYQFRLLAFPILGDVDDDTCLSSNCANNTRMVSTMFTVSINRPPAFGMFAASPDEGIDSVTMFSLFALNWHDEDLPIFFSFYRWNEFSNDFDLIRQRMQINSMETKLHSPLATGNMTSNYRVPLRVLVSDYFSSTSQIETSVGVLPQKQQSAASSSGVAAAIVTAEVNSLITSIDSATKEVQTQSNPEIILPLTSTAINQLNSLQCSTKAVSHCQNLISANSNALRNAVVKYNAGFFTLSGVSLYMSQLLLQNPSNLDDASVDDLLVVFQFVAKTLQTVGFTSGDGNKLLNTLCVVAEKLVDKYAMDVASLSMSNTDAEVVDDDDGYFRTFLSPSVNSTLLESLSTVQKVSDAIHTVHLSYFQILPFGYRQLIDYGSHFNVTMTKGYWDGHRLIADAVMNVDSIVHNANNQSSNSDETSGLIYFAIEDVFFTDPILPQNSTSSYTFLSSVSSLPRCFNVSLFSQNEDGSNSSVFTTGPCVSSAQTKNIELSIFREVTVNKDVDMYLSFKEVNRLIVSPPNSLASAATIISVQSSASVEGRRLSGSSNTTEEYFGQYAIFRNCSDFSSTVVNRPRIICTSEMTSGPAYVFDDFVCDTSKVDHVVMFVCPVYREEIVCTRDGLVHSIGFVSASHGNETEVTCVYSLSQIVSMQSAKYVSAASISGSFSYSYAYNTAIAASIDLLPPKVSPTADKSSTSSTVNYIAIVVIGVVAILFSAFLYNRTKTVKETVIPDVMPAAETEAHYVDLPLTETINHEIIVGASGPADTGASMVMVNGQADSMHGVRDVVVELADQYPDLEGGGPLAEMVKFDAIAFPVLQ